MNRTLITHAIFCLLISFNANLLCMDNDQQKWQLSKTFDLNGEVNKVTFNSSSELVGVLYSNTKAIIYNHNQAKRIAAFIHLTTMDSIHFNPEHELLAMAHFSYSSNRSYRAVDCLTNLSVDNDIFDIFPRRNNNHLPDAISDINQELKFDSHDTTVPLFRSDINPSRKLCAIGYIKAEFDKTERAINIFEYGKSENHNPFSVDFGAWSTSLKFSPDGMLFACAIPEKAYIFDISNKEEKKEVASFPYENNQTVTQMSISPCNRLFATVTEASTELPENALHIYDLTTQDKNEIFCRNFTCHITSLDFISDGKYLAIGCSDNNAYILDVSNNEIIASLEHGGRVTSVKFSPCGLFLVTGSQDKKMRIFFINKTTINTPVTKNCFLI